MSLIKFIRNTIESLRFINMLKKNYERDINSLRIDVRSLVSDVDLLESRLTEINNFEINVDVGLKSPSKVIILGKFKGRDYVECFEIQNECLQDVIGLIKDLEKRGGKARLIDSPVKLRNWL